MDKKILKCHIYTYILMFYFLIAPLEDILVSSFGTLARYVALLVVIVGIIENRNKFKFRINAVTLCFVWMLILPVLSCFWSIDFDMSFWRIGAYLFVPGVCFFVSLLDFSEDEYKKIIYSAIWGGIIAFLYLIVIGGVSYFGTGRLSLSNTNDPNNFAALMILPFALSFQEINASNKRKKITNFILLGVFTIIILLTGSRGALLACISFFIVYLFTSKAYKKVKVIVGIIIGSFIIATIVIFVLPDYMVERLFSIDSYLVEGMSENQRLTIWKITITKIVPESGLFGVGAGCAPLPLAMYYGNAKGVHNTFITMLVEYGVLGIPFFMLLLWNIFKVQIKNKAIINISLLVGICVIIFFLDSYPKKFFWNVIMIILISSSVEYKKNMAINNTNLNL